MSMLDLGVDSKSNSILVGISIVIVIMCIFVIEIMGFNVQSLGFRENYRSC